MNLQLGDVLDAPLTQTIISAVIGGLISAGVSLWFYRRSTQDLRSEAAALREETQKARASVQLLGRWLRYAGVIPTGPGEDGDLQGLSIGEGHLRAGPASLSGAGSVTSPTSTAEAHLMQGAHQLRAQASFTPPAADSTEGDRE